MLLDRCLFPGKSHQGGVKGVHPFTPLPQWRLAAPLGGECVLGGGLAQGLWGGERGSAVLRWRNIPLPELAAIFSG